MKKKVLIISCLMISFSFVFSQTNSFPASGNVGIGTTSPVGKLQVIGGKIFIGTPGIIDSYDQLYSAGANPGFRQEVQRTDGGAAFDFVNAYAHKIGSVGDALWGKIGIFGDFGNIGVDAPPTVSYMYFGAGPNVSYLNNTFRLYPNGTAYFNDKIGVGTSTPQAKLDVNGTTYSRKLFVGTPDANTVTNMGTSLLAVNGTAVFVKAKVALYGTAWPDYVFAPTYKLPKLDSLEQFIKLNGHLPEVPKAEVIEKNGIDLGNTQVLLLKKIEELTLLLIEQNRERQILEKTITSLNNRIEKLEKVSN